MKSGLPEIVRVGIVGLGTAGRQLVPALAAHGGTRLAAIAESNDTVRASVAAETGVHACATLEDLLARKDVDAVFLATPTMLHAVQGRKAAEAGKHILVEKPMAGSMADALALVEAAERAGVVLVVGHSRSYDSPIRRMRAIIADGRLGRVRMIHSIAYTDWMYRPRRPDELDLTQGGGVIYRQGAHQVDILRLLGGGLVRGVRAQLFDWDTHRRGVGAHQMFLAFADGVAATAIYSGYGAFSTSELCHGIGERGFPEEVGAIGEARRAFSERAGGAEIEAKRRRSAAAVRLDPPHNPFFGMTLVSCEHGDMRQSPSGLYLYSERGREEVALPADAGPYHNVIAEFYEAVTGARKPTHDGRWGLANLEVCEAAIRSSQLDAETRLSHQVAADR